MEYREIEVTVLSAQDLKNVNFLGGVMSPNAEVWIYSSMKMQTGVSSGGGRNPSWNCALRLACEDKLFLSGGEISIAIYNRGSFSANTLLGTVTVSLSELSALKNAAYNSQASASMDMSVQIRSKSGKAQGVLNLAVKVGAMVKQAEHHYEAPAADNDTAPVMGYPAAGPYPRRLPAPLLDQKKQQYYPPEYHRRYGQPAALYQREPSLKLSTWTMGGPANGGGGRTGMDPMDTMDTMIDMMGGGCGGGCG